MKAGTLDRWIWIERPIADDALDGAGSGSWEPVDTPIPAGIVDALPSRGERIADGISIASHPARVRIRHRDGITPDMRILIGRWVDDGEGGIVWQTDRVTQIVSGPAELGRREALEFMVEEYRPAGNPS